jgi:periplasmic protein TonB
MDIRSNLALAFCIVALSGSAAFAETQSGSPSSDPQPAGAGTGTKVTTEGAGGSEEFVTVDKLPEVVKKTAPKYPAGARKRGEQGTVFVQAFVDTTGVPVRVKVPKGKGVTPELDKAAVEAVSQWRFEPATAKGKPVGVYIVLPVKFTLK